jgi:hypothetical protein
MTRLTLLLILALFAQAPAQSRKLIIADSPKPATVEGYEGGHCVGLRNRIRICKVLSESDGLFVVEKEGKSIRTWRAETYIGETDDFKVMRGDLDGDRKSELIVANRDTTSAGLAVSVWSITIFPDADFRSVQSPLSFSVKEYGAHGTFVPGGGRLNILTTDWVWGNDPKGRRGEGLYLVGQWWRYQRGELLPVPKRILARRYLFSFARERFATWESDCIPYQWLTDRHTEFVSTDFITGPSDTNKVGVIESVAPNDDITAYRIKIRFKADDGQTSEFTYVNENGLDIDRYLGDASTGTLYPARYLPSNAKKWLSGRRATLRTYKENRTQILWLEPEKGTK